MVVARMTSTLKRQCAGIKDWTITDDHHAASEFMVKLSTAWGRGAQTQAAGGRHLGLAELCVAEVGPARR